MNCLAIRSLHWNNRSQGMKKKKKVMPSVSLERYHFPEHVVIVLGREKEGVPQEVLTV